MKTSPTVILLAAIAGLSLAHPVVQNAEANINAKLAARNHAASKNGIIDWNDPSIYKVVDWNTVDHGTETEAPAVGEATETRMQEGRDIFKDVDWNDPANNPNVDWDSINYDHGGEATPSAGGCNAKRQDWNDPEIYKNVDWKEPKT